jgi:hypothetical protein
MLAAVLFEEVPPDASGISWIHDNGRSAARHLPESLGPGVAFLDYDNDGRMDVYLVNSGPTEFYQPRNPARNALYRNEGGGRFRDVTREAGVAGGTFGMGAAAGDYDNDGDSDLYVTAHGRAVLYRNNGDGTFTDVAERAGVAVRGFTTSAVWFDYDNDGWLDLFVCSFVRYAREDWSRCGKDAAGHPFYCIPRVFVPTPSRLYRNNRDGAFTLASAGTDIERSPGKALGAVATDVNNDGRMDLFVANDTVQNFLFLNRAAGWEEAALPAEVAYSADGEPRSGMGVDSADIDGDGLTELFVSNVDNEKFSLYRNKGGETFIDVAHRHGIAAATRSLSGWGLKFFDFDNDGATDLLMANGHPDDRIEQHKTGVAYAEPLLLFQNNGGRLRDVSAAAGPVFQRAFPARGLAIGDYDNDGRLDALVGNNGERPLLLRNVSGSANRWVGLHLVGKRANRDAVGARVTWSVAGARRSMLKVAGGSYLSSHDPRMVLGLGSSGALDWIEVRWPLPSRVVERFTGVTPGRYVRLEEGTGSVPEAANTMGHKRSRK